MNNRLQHFVDKSIDSEITINKKIDSDINRIQNKCQVQYIR